MLAWASKAVVYALGQLAIGMALFRRLARPRDANADAWLELQRLATQARVLSFVLIAALLVRLWAQTASAFGAPDAWSFDNLRVIAFESRWGNAWQLQMLAGAVLLGAAWALRSHRAAWILFEAGALGLALAMPLLGHAAGSPGRYVIHTAHNLGAAAWLGTLGVTVMASWRPAAVPGIALAVGRFSPIALTSAAMLTLTGVGAAWLYVGSWQALWTSGYGRVLSAKLAVVVVVVACGWTNWRRVRRAAVPRRVLMTAEWVAALIVVALTGVLSETEHP